MENLEKLEEQTKRAEKEPHYNFSEIAEMEPAMISLIKKLKDKIESGEYDTLISDDVGGRIPTLILREIMLGKGRYDNENKLNTFFLAGGRGDWQPDTKESEEFISRRIIPSMKKKALLITEYIDSGDSVAKFIKLFEKAGLKNFDVAAVVISQPEYAYKRQRIIFPSHDLYAGEKGSVPSLYRVRGWTGGVHKTVGGGKLLRSKNEWYEYRDKRLRQEAQKAVNKTREDAHTMAERVLEKVW